MVERDLRIIQKEFRDVAGFMATAEITEDGASRSAGIIVALEEKIFGEKTQPIDLFRATLATSQLIERWSQLRQHLAAGSISSVNDEETLKLVQEKFTGGNLPKDEIMRLTTITYVANPGLGANKAMDVLSKLRTIYADISLKPQPHS
jgi:hypothetical protein